MGEVKLNQLSKRFGGVAALSDVSLSFRSGEIHAVVGENGAGKSTVMKILGGILQADSGTIEIDGQLVEIPNVLRARELGISIVCQELNLMPDLTVAENIFLGCLPTKYGVVNRREMERRGAELLKSMGVDIPVTSLAGELSVACQQMVSIANALAIGGDIVILDEPTAALNTREVETLYGIVRDLKRQGKTVIYVSHRMKEIFDLSDRISVLRDGRYVATVETSASSEDEVVSLMVGRAVMTHRASVSGRGDEVVMSVSGLSCAGFYEDISFELHRGEVLGFAGLMGCGKDELVKSLFGLYRPDSGVVSLDGQVILDVGGGVDKLSCPRSAIELGIGYVTEDRKGSGIFAAMDVLDNVLGGSCRLNKFGLLDDEKEAALLAEYTESLDIKYTSRDQAISSLSGGNQQKCMLARALATQSERVLILMEPTRGIDVGAKSEIYGLLEELSKKGMSILVVSSELSELLSTCHRLCVVFQGRMTGLLDQADFDEELVMSCATGQREFYSGASKG